MHTAVDQTQQTRPCTEKHAATLVHTHLEQNPDPQSLKVKVGQKVRLHSGCDSLTSYRQGPRVTPWSKAALAWALEPTACSTAADRKGGSSVPTWPYLDRPWLRPRCSPAQCQSRCQGRCCGCGSAGLWREEMHV